MGRKNPPHRPSLSSRAAILKDSPQLVVHVGAYDTQAMDGIAADLAPAIRWHGMVPHVLGVRQVGSL